MAVPYVRILSHYIHAPYLLIAAAEALLFAAAAYLGHFTRFQQFPHFIDFLPHALGFSCTLLLAMVAMGVYESHIREGFSGMALRTAAAVFLLGTMGMAILSYFLPMFAIGRGPLIFAAIEAFALAVVFRWVAFGFLDQDFFKKRVVVIGTGQRALKIASRTRRKSDQRAFVLQGFIDIERSGSNPIEEYGAHRIVTDLPLLEYCRIYRIDEIIVAVDERRRNLGSGGGLPLDELIDCRLSGIAVCDAQQFIEREARKVDIDLLRPSWLVFADGFLISTPRAITKRTFDLVASIGLLSIAWPLMLLTAVCVKLENWYLPVLYRQKRIGLDGRPFEVLKFRSMNVEDEEQNATWTANNDARITTVGRFIRKTRIDELPQLINVLRNEMSFVGPRPERPVFVKELADKIPFYEQRHRIKPGITGWAQLCYPYGASVEDAKEKLQYDLYYLKNNSLLLDMIILLQTVEVVLVGEGAR